MFIETGVAPEEVTRAPVMRTVSVCSTPFASRTVTGRSCTSGEITSVTSVSTSTFVVTSSRRVTSELRSSAVCPSAIATARLRTSSANGRSSRSRPIGTEFLPRLDWTV